MKGGTSLRVRGIAEEAVIGAERYVDRHHHRDVDGAGDDGPAEVAPGRTKAEHDNVVNGAGEDDGVGDPERPEDRRGRSGP